MEIIVLMVVAAAGAWMLTKANCIGNCFGCLFFILICAALATVMGIAL